MLKLMQNAGMLHQHSITKRFLREKNKNFRTIVMRFMSTDEVRNASPYIPRRALMYVPGSDMKKIKKISTLHHLDSVALDCEDGVALNAKEEARTNIRQILDNNEQQLLEFGRTEVTVRVNSVDSGLCDEDLDVVLSSKNMPSSVLLPKVDYTDQLQWFSDITNEILHHNPNYDPKKSPKMNLILFIESAQGLLALPEICKTAWQLSVENHFVPDALVFGSDDYCADIGATRTKDAKELIFARQYFVMVAKAFKLQAIDIVHIDYKDTIGLKEQALEGYQMGFTGKQIIHPVQIEPCQTAFTPTAEKIQWAQELIESFQKQEASGKGAFTFRGSMIDMPLVLQAKNIVKLASLCDNSGVNK